MPLQARPDHATLLRLGSCALTILVVCISKLWISGVGVISAFVSLIQPRCGVLFRSPHILEELAFAVLLGVTPLLVWGWYRFMSSLLEIFVFFRSRPAISVALQLAWGISASVLFVYPFMEFLFEPAPYWCSY